MKVFVAGATGAIGKRLVPALTERGHEVVAMTRSRLKMPALRRQGAEPVVADALDRSSVVREVERSCPDVVVHQLTDLTDVTSYRSFDAAFAPTNRLRTEGTENLLAAARAAGARRFVAQSYGNWIYAPAGSSLKREEDGLDASPPLKQRKSLDAIRHLETAVVGADEMEGLALRFGAFYGPGTGIAPDGDLVDLVRRRKLPVIGEGTGVWSFIHVDDAAAATIAAIEGGTPGLYNVADDDPAPVAEWLPELARIVGAKPPQRVPVWLGRLAVGDAAVSMMTRIRGMSNGKARRELAWNPRHGSWRDGFRAVLDQPALAAGECTAPERG
jgi:2-alkyl-3-oxoalkanoate reductase